MGGLLASKMVQLEEKLDFFANFARIKQLMHKKILKTLLNARNENSKKFMIFDQFVNPTLPLLAIFGSKKWVNLTEIRFFRKVFPVFSA